MAPIYDPTREELFVAERGGGAFLNGEPIHVSEQATLVDSMLVTGFPYDVHKRISEIVGLFGEFVGRARAVRRLGSAALDLCYIAAGRMDGFWEQDLKPWDVAAGGIIVQEAGGQVTDFQGVPFSSRRHQVIATNGQIHDDMLRVTAGLHRPGRRVTIVIHRSASFLYSATPPPSHRRLKPARNCGDDRARWASTSPPSARSSIRIQLTRPFGDSMASGQYGLVALVHEVAEVQAVAGELLHVVREGSHAGQDQLSMVVAHQAPCDRLPPEAVGAVPLGLQHHGGRRAERPQRRREGCRQQPCGHGPAARRQPADGDPGEDGDGDDRRHHVADPERVPLEEGVCRQHQKPAERQYHQRGRAIAPPDDHGREQDGAGERGEEHRVGRELPDAVDHLDGGRSGLCRVRASGTKKPPVTNQWPMV